MVLTGNPHYKVKDAVVVHTKEQLLDELKQYDSKDIYVIGGESIYRMLLDQCDTAYVTKIDYTYEADTYVPNLDRLAEWEMTDESEEQTYFDLEYRFVTYRRRG